MSNNNLCFGLKNEFKSREIKLFLSDLFPDFEFYELESDLGRNENKVRKPNSGTFSIGIDELTADFLYILDLNFPLGTCLSNETELFIAREISNRYNLNLIVSGDYYDKIKFPYNWILVDKNKFYEAIEHTNKNGLSEYDIEKELIINLKITNAQQCVICNG